MHDPNASNNVVLGNAGILNKGNTCYLNAILQCLTKIPKLAQYFIQREYENDFAMAVRNDIQKVDIAITCGFGNVCNDVWSGKRVCDPLLLVRALRSQGHNSQFGGFGQNDAHEILVFLLDKIHMCFKTNVKVTVSGTPKSAVEARLLQSYTNWQKYLNVWKHSIITELVAGQYESATTCKGCGNTSFTYDPFQTVSLQIPEKAATLYDCLDEFCHTENLDGDNSYKCDNCKNVGGATKHIGFWLMPDILIVHLKRFDHQGNKIETVIDFPFENLDATKYKQLYDVPNVPNVEKYNLFGVVTHVGGLNGGHYTSFTKHPRTMEWYFFNDTNVAKCKQPAIENAYILFYQKIY